MSSARDQIESQPRGKRVEINVKVGQVRTNELELDAIPENETQAEGKMPTPQQKSQNVVKNKGKGPPKATQRVGNKMQEKPFGQDANEISCEINTDFETIEEEKVDRAINPEEEENKQGAT